MKKIIMALFIATGLFAGAAQAASSSGQFDVNITLTSTCTLSTVNAVAFAYTSLQGSAQNSTAGTGTFTVTCTNQLPYSFGLQAGTGAATPPGSASISVTDAVVNLGYTLNAPVAGTGNGAAQSLAVTGTMAANQSGNCNAASCTNATSGNKTQTLILNY